MENVSSKCYTGIGTSFFLQTSTCVREIARRMNSNVITAGVSLCSGKDEHLQMFYHDLLSLKLGFSGIQLYMRPIHLNYQWKFAIKESLIPHIWHLYNIHATLIYFKIYFTTSIRYILLVTRWHIRYLE